MKKLSFLLVLPAFLLSSCTTNQQAAGTMAGATFGSVIGSSLGGIMGGPRGSDFGTLIGMITGAAVGNVATAPRSEQRESVDNDYGNYRMQRYNDDTYTSNYNAVDYQRRTESSAPQYSAPVRRDTLLSIQNLRFIDDNRNQTIDAGETCHVVFEIMNRTGKTVYDVVPYLSETSGNKHIIISPTTRIEQIAPGYGVRYTATIKADNKLDDGTANFSIAISHSTCDFTQMRTFSIQTAGR
jgi:predicted small secreted protein